MKKFFNTDLGALLVFVVITVLLQVLFIIG